MQVSQKASDGKRNLCMFKKMGFLAPKRNSQSDLFTLLYGEESFYLAREERSHHEIIVDL